MTALGQRPISDDDVADLPLRVRVDVRQLSDAIPGADDPERITLVQTRGLRRSQQVDTVLAAFVGACDGTLPAGALLDAVSSLLDLAPSTTRQAALPQIADLWTAGFLTLD